MLSIADTETVSYVIYAGKKYMKNLKQKGARKMAKNEIQKRMKILEKVISLGCLTEEDVKKLTPKDLTKDESISFSDLLLIYDLQESVKNSRLFSFLSKGINEVN